MLYDVEGYDYAEIAEMTGVSLGTVKSRIHRGRLALRAILEDRMDTVPWLTAGPTTTRTTRSLIAALLDRDASATERAAADDRRRSCPDCAALYADLLALAGAVREQPAAAPRPGLRADRRRCRAADRRAGRGTGPRGDPSDAV